MAKKAKDKVDPKVAELVEALGTEGELERLAEVHHRQPTAELARAVLARDGTANAGVASAWLRALAGSATAADVVAIVELATTARSRRMAIAAALATVVDRVDVPQVARAIENLEPGAPFAPVVLAHRAVVGGPLAATLAARASFLERHAKLLAECTREAKERARETAGAALMKLTGDERLLAALWIMTEGKASDAAIAWARAIAVAEPSIHVVHGAIGLAEDLRDPDLAVLLAPVSTERALDLLVEALERGWGGSAENLAKVRPELFADPRAFAALVSAVDARRGNVIGELFGPVTRHWASRLSDEQAARIATIMVTLLDDDEYKKAVGNACNYFEHPGGLPVFRAALEGTLTDETREEVYTAVHSIPHRAAQDLLIDRLFVETEQIRYLIFGFKECVPVARHADVLARLDATRSLHAAWIYVGCQVHWAERPRHVLDIVERVLDWPGGEPSKRAFMYSHGVAAALELHRYPLARRCLAALGATKTAVDPAELDEEADTVLADDELADTLAKLRSEQLDAADHAFAARLAAARAAGTPLALTDDELGTAARSRLHWLLHRDAKTHEAWFLDRESELFYYDGFAIAPIPFQHQVLVPVHTWDRELTGLAEMCAGWTTAERSLHTAERDFRYVLRCGARLIVRFLGTYNNTWWHPFVWTFPDEAAATRAFAALVGNPLPGYTAVDPFYVPGKDGGTFVYDYGNGTEYGFVVGKQTYWGDEMRGTPRPCDSHDAAIAAFAAAEASALQRGLCPRKIVQQEQIRPLEDTPLATWLEDRARNSQQPAAWHAESLALIEAALDLTGIEFDREVAIGPPATADQLAAYDATLPEPMPDELRGLWTAASTLRWRVGDRTMRLLAPDEVIAKRQHHRDALVPTIKPKLLKFWPMAHLDVIIVGTDDAPEIGYDNRQTENDTWMAVGIKSRDEYDYTIDLSRAVGSLFIHEYVKTLTKTYSQLKKLHYGESIATKKK